LRLAQEIADSPFMEFAVRTLGKSLFLSADQLSLRFRSPERPEASLPFHQDCFYFALKEPEMLISPEPMMLVLWLPFVQCGKESPAIDLITSPTPRALPLSTKRSPHFGHLEIAGEALPADATVWSPHFCAGDAAVFTERTVHRSRPTKPTDATRTSVDLRILSLARYPRALSGKRAVLIPDLTLFTLP
jgi:hypothetical protein